MEIVVAIGAIVVCIGILGIYSFLQDISISLRNIESFIREEQNNKKNILKG
jgi:hypothetical protein